MDFRAPGAAPFSTPAFQFPVNNALHAQQQRQATVEILRVEREQHAVGGAQAVLEFIDQLGVVWRAQFLFTLGQHHQVDRQGAGDPDDRVDGIQECTLRAFLVGCATGHQHPAEFLVDEIALERRSLPVFRVYRLHVVHHVDHQGQRRACIVETPDAGMSGSRHQPGFGKSDGRQVIT